MGQTLKTTAERTQARSLALTLELRIIELCGNTSTECKTGQGGQSVMVGVPGTWLCRTSAPSVNIRRLDRVGDSNHERGQLTTRRQLSGVKGYNTSIVCR